ncbi:NDP-sugar synthase, partial [Candidatus Altiarchaeota archaeon]
ENNAVATIALTPVEDPSRFGVAHLRGPHILSFEEKPSKKKQGPQLINAGIYILNPNVIDYLPAGKSMIEKDLFPKLAAEGKLYGYPFDGMWLDTGTPDAYEKAIKTWKPIN